MIEDINTRILCANIITHPVHGSNQPFGLAGVIRAKSRCDETDTGMSVTPIEVVILKTRLCLVCAVHR